MALSKINFKRNSIQLWARGMLFFMIVSGRPVHAETLFLDTGSENSIFSCPEIFFLLFFIKCKIPPPGDGI